jgi:hypothetical protein
VKPIIALFIIAFLSSTSCFGQSRKTPKNLKQAIVYLNNDCPDSLKAAIKITNDNNLRKLVYPEDGNYMTISNWLSGEDENNRLIKYFNSKGISYFQADVLLIAFKQSLLRRKIDEEEIYRPFKIIEAKWAKEDKVRFTTDSLYGIYIPKDLEDCFQQINSFWPDSVKQRMAALTEDDFSVRLHFGLGLWMRNNWQLWGGSRLSKYFNDTGIYHPDDMSGIILTSYHRRLNGKNIELNEQIASYKQYWKQANEEEKQRMQNELSKFRIGDTVIYKYDFGFVSKKQKRKSGDENCIATGIVTGLDSEKCQIKVKLVKSCDRRGIIYSNEKNSKIWNENTKAWEKTRKRIKRRMHNKQERWFYYERWVK